MMWTGTLSSLNTLMEDKRPVRGTGGDGTGQKTQTLIFAYGRFVNAETWMCNVLHQIAEGAVGCKHPWSLSPLRDRLSVHNDVRYNQMSKFLCLWRTENLLS